MTMSTRTAVRQRCLDLNKQLKIIRTYEKYIQFENESTEPTRTLNGFDSIPQRVEELMLETARTIEALKEKQPVRIPEMSGPKTSATVEDNCMIVL